MAGCSTPRNKGIPSEDWPDFIPLSQIEQYLGFQYSTPTMGQIYGTLRNLKIVEEAKNVELLIPGKNTNTFKSLSRSRDLLAFQPISFRATLSPDEIVKLKEILLDYDSYGDKVLCPSKVDLGFRFDVGERWVDVTIGSDCGVIGIWPNEGLGDQRTVTPKLFDFAEEISRWARQKGSEQPVPGYPPQSVGSPDP